MACFLDTKRLEDVPNFMKDGKEKFWDNFYTWLDGENMGYLEYEINYDRPSDMRCYHDGFCILTGDSNLKDGVLHSVLGYVKWDRTGNRVKYYFKHNPNGDQKNFLNGNPKLVGFLYKKF